jgi:hypothetical protein
VGLIIIRTDSNRALLRGGNRAYPNAGGNDAAAQFAKCRHYIPKVIKM